MRFRTASIFLTGCLAGLVAVSANAGPFDGVTPCHDMKHLLDAGMAEGKAQREHPTEGDKTFCQASPGIAGVLVCMTGPMHQLGDDSGRYTLQYKFDGKSLLTWSESGPELVDPYSFTIESADLDGDGELDTIIGVLESVSNGLAVEGWSLYVVPSGGKALLGPFALENYSVISGLYQVPGRRGCVLLASKWEGDTEPRRGYGTYAKGHWYVLQGDKLVEYMKLPALERRLLYRFGNEMGDPLWFKDSTVRLLKQ